MSERYPETAVLRQIAGVGTLTSLAYVLTLEDPARFADSRRVGAYLGLTPGTRQSGSDPQLHKKRAAVAVARKLAVVLHRLWLTQQRYEPLRQEQERPAA